MKDGIAKSNLEYVTEEKDLGILIDSKLKFRAHVGTEVCQRLISLHVYQLSSLHASYYIKSLIAYKIVVIT